MLIRRGTSLFITKAVAFGGAVALLVGIGALPQSAFATQALNAGQHISTTSAKLLNKTGSLTGSQQNIVICDPATPLSGSTSVTYDAFDVQLEDIAPGPGYSVNYHQSWVQVFTGNFSELKSLQTTRGEGGPTIDPPGVFYQKLDAYLANGLPDGVVETGYMQIVFNQTGEAGPFNTGGSYNGFKEQYDLFDYDVIDSDGIQAGARGVPVEFDNYLAVFNTFNDNTHTYTHFGNPDGPNGPDLLTGPDDKGNPQTYDSRIPGEVIPSTVSTPEPSFAAIVLLGGVFFAGRRRRA